MTHELVGEQQESGGPDGWALAEAIRARTVTAHDLVEQALARIDAQDPHVNAVTDRCDATARAAAQQVDELLRRGEPLGPLAGVPITVKDHVWLAGMRATNGSRALAGFVPDATAVCVRRLQDAGAIVVAKTNNPEFCYRGTTSNELFGTTRNPRDTTRTTGGSSGGAAASVVTGMAPIAVGTDGGGSIRIPSAFCGACGIKPTFGLVPKMPGFRGWPTLSVDGPIAMSVRDLALALSVMAGSSVRDPMSLPGGGPAPSLRAWAAPKSLSGMRVAVSADLGLSAVDDDVRACFRSAVDALADAGAHLVEEHPAVDDPCPLWDAVALPEGYASEGPLLERSPELVGNDATQIIRAGASASARDYLDAQDRRSVFTERWLSFLSEVDVLVTPTLPVTAFGADRLGPPSVAGRPTPEGFDAWCALVLPANLAGTPAVSLPIGTGDDGLPVGMQVTSSRWTDWELLRTCAAIEALLRDH